MYRWIIGVACVVWVGCGGGDADAKDAGGNCKLDLSLGQVRGGQFADIAQGDPVELVLGFQGIRMLPLVLDIKGTEAATADVLAHLTIEATAQDLDQRDRSLELVANSQGGRRVENYLFFVHDLAGGAAINSQARLDIIARTKGCEGTLVREIELRDDDECVDFSIVLDAAVAADIPDAAVACEATP